MVENPLYSFAGDASIDFQLRVQQATKDMAQALDRTLAISALGDDANRPFSAVREGEILHVVYPLTVNNGDLLGGLITVLSSILPTVVLHEGDQGWIEPDWSPESRRHLAGLITGIKSTPDSFSHTSSPTDLARVSLWITACSSALSIPGGVKDAHGDVLPTVIGGAKSASKYMSKVIAGLRANVTEESSVKAIDTLAMLLKLWQKASAERALSIVRKCKIAWSTLLFRAAPTTVVKGKKRQPDQTVLRSPPKPSRSPWLSASERNALSDLFKDDWSHLEEIRKEWNALIPEQQHRQFNNFKNRITSYYERLNQISNSVHAKLGKRKHWIETYCKEDKYNPKAKKGESESFLLSAHFFKTDLSRFPLEVAKVFSPVTYLVDDKYRTLEVWANCFPSESDSVILSASDYSQSEDGSAYKLWQVWADLFHPKFTKQSIKVDEASPTMTSNFFSILFPKGDK
jgi:hypothetical protein